MSDLHAHDVPLRDVYEGEADVCCPTCQTRVHVVKTRFEKEPSTAYILRYSPSRHDPWSKADHHNWQFCDHPVCELTRQLEAERTKYAALVEAVASAWIAWDAESVRNMLIEDGWDEADCTLREGLADFIAALEER